MELIKKNFYMEQKKAYTEDQLILEEDMVLGSEYEDMKELIAGKTKIRMVDQKTEDGKLYLKGSLPFEVLYEGESKGSLYLYKNEMDFEEEIYIDSLQTGDEVDVNCYLEDFTPQMINSRKLNVKALVTIKVSVEELKDAKVATGIEQMEEHVESQTMKFEAVQLKTHKKDVFRIKQDIAIQGNSPNIGKVLWDDVNLRTLDWKAGEGKVLIHGEVSVFLLYQAQTQAGEISFFETVIPISGNLDITGCQEKNLIDLEVSFLENHVDIKEDFDGERRIIGLEMSVHMRMRCMEESQTEIIKDIYGTTKEITCKTEKIHYKKLLYSGQTKKKLLEKIPVEKRLFSSEPQLLYCNGAVTIEKTSIKNEELLISGFLWVTYLLYHAQDQKYRVRESQIPVEVTVPFTGIEMGAADHAEDLTIHVTADVEQIMMNMSDMENMEMRALLNLHMLVLTECEQEVLSSFELSPIDAKKITDLPGMVVYFAKEGDSLWKIGKKYYMSVNQIREQNHIVGDVLHQGDKILLMKNV